MKPLDFCLVMMPYQALERPSPAMGILTATTRKAGFSVKGYYPGFRLAEKIGDDTYLRLAGSYINLLGEWTFSRAAFPEANDDPESYYQLLNQTAINTNHLPYSLSQLLAIRENAETFIREEASRIVAANPRVVGCGSQFQQHCSSLAILREIKRLNPEIITLLGGQCCSCEQGQIAHDSFKWIDLVFSGEADHALPELLHLLFEYGLQIPKNKIPVGVIAPTGFVADTNGKPAYAIVPDMNVLPDPDHDDYFRELNAWHGNGSVTPYLAFEGGRGCEWAHRTGGCSFCATASERAIFRPKSSARLLSELTAQKEKYGFAAFEAADEMCSPAFFNEFFPKLASMEKPPFILSFDVRATLEEHNVKLLRDAGCVWLQPGIESLSDKALNCMRKGISSAVAIRLLRLGIENGIGISWNILRGFPNEQSEWYDEIAELVPALTHIEPPYTFGQLRIDRNSLYQREPERFGLNLSPAKFYRHLYPLDDVALKKIASFFENDNGPTGLSADDPSVQKLSSAIEAWKKSFHGDQEKRPHVYLLDKNTRIVEDTRPCAKDRVCELSDMQLRLLTACRDPLPIACAGKVLSQRGFSEPEQVLNAIIEKLLDLRFLVKAGNSIISVVCTVPRFSIPNPEDILAGNIQLR